MELKRIDFDKARELVGISWPSAFRQRNAYNEDDCRELVTMIGRSLCPGFVIDEQNRFVYENVRKWCDGDPDFLALDPQTSKTVKGDLRKGLYIAGNAGSGKTLCTRVFAKYACYFGLKFAAGDGEQRLGWRNFFSSEICESYAHTGDVNALISIPSLCIQDVGSEPLETLYMGNKKTVIGYILQMRGERPDLITVITSNNRIRENIYGDRVTSRLYAMCNYYELKGKDRRV